MAAQQNLCGTSLALAETYVKNTFIEMGVPEPAEPTRRRNRSSPPSQRFSSFFIGEAHCGSEKASDDASTGWCTNTEAETPVAHSEVETPVAYSEDALSDVRTDASEEDFASLPAEDCSFSGGGLEYSVTASHVHGNEIFATLPPSQPATSHLLSKACGYPKQVVQVAPPMQASFNKRLTSDVQCFPCSKSSQIPKGVRLNSSASAFQPRGLADKSPTKPYADQIAQVVRVAEKALRACNYPADVECFQGEKSWNILITLQFGDPCRAEHMLTVAKGALLEACEVSKSIYVMGYRTPQPFKVTDQGFEATLGAMASAPRACWHVFKKGFCRHGTECNKEHPATMVPVSVCVASVTPKPADMTNSYMQQVADAVQKTASELLRNPYTVDVKTVKVASSKKWTIEAVVKLGSEYIPGSFEHVCFAAKEALTSALQFTDNVIVMSAGSKSSPVQQSGGFEVTLGGVRKKSNACWNLCSKGFCHRDLACTWEHPEFYSKVAFEIVLPDTPNMIFKHSASSYRS